MSDFYDKVNKRLLKSANDVHYTDTSRYIKEPVFIPDEATVLAAPRDYIKVNPDDSLEVMTDAEYEATLDLNDYKELKYAAIDQRTNELIADGTTFDNGSGAKQFSNSLSAQSNWTNIKAGKEDFNGMGLFPLKITTKDNDEFELNYADVDGFWQSVVGTIKTHYDSGRTLKKQIHDAVDKTTVDAVVDNR
jgi:hypothetical protein